MDENLRLAAVQAISNVFETMFFVFLEPLEPETEDWRAGLAASTDAYRQCTIGFQGPIRGQLRLLIPSGLAGELATNFLGLETEASEDQSMDMVKELTNMVCGNLFSLFDKQGVYLLDMPLAQAVRIDRAALGTGPPGALKLDFLAEDRMIRLEIEPEG